MKYIVIALILISVLVVSGCTENESIPTPMVSTTIEQTTTTIVDETTAFETEVEADNWVEIVKADQLPDTNVECSSRYKTDGTQYWLCEYKSNILIEPETTTTYVYQESYIFYDDSESNDFLNSIYINETGEYGAECSRRYDINGTQLWKCSYFPEGTKIIID